MSFSNISMLHINLALNQGQGNGVVNHFTSTSPALLIIFG